MSTNYGGSQAANMSAAGSIGSSGVGTPAYTTTGSPDVEVDVVNVPLKDRIRWGPIVAGIVTAFAVLLFLTVLGIALGLSAIRDNTNANPQTWGTAAGIWGGLTLLVAFFLGGWLAARAAETLREGDGILNGFITGAATLLLLVWLATTAVTGALGFFATTVSNLAAAPAVSRAVETGQVQAPQQAEQAANQAAQNPEQAVPQQAEQAAQAAAQTAGPGAWGTTIAILLALAAATLGGMVGQGDRTLPSRRAVVATR